MKFTLYILLLSYTGMPIVLFFPCPPVIMTIHQSSFWISNRKAGHKKKKANKFNFKCIKLRKVEWKMEFWFSLFFLLSISFLCSFCWESYTFYGTICDTDTSHIVLELFHRFKYMKWIYKTYFVKDMWRVYVAWI